MLLRIRCDLVLIIISDDKLVESCSHMKKKKNILIIYFNPDSLQNTRLTVLHHLKAIESSDGNNEILYHNVKDVYLSFMTGGECGGIAKPDISSSWDAIVLHYSFLGIRTRGWPFRELKKHFSWIRDLKGLKVAIPQDEGDYASMLDDWLFELGTDIIFSVHYAIDRPLYPIMRHHATIYPCLPGYIDEQTASEYAKKIRPIAERKIDIVYRARRLPPWFGIAGRLKSRIAEIAEPIAIEKGFHVDISTSQENTINGTEWFDFIASGKTVLGTPGGYSTIDWRGELKVQAKQILGANPGINFQQMSRLMPVGWDDYCLFTITPRHLEAVALSTCQILISDEYKGILVPDIHYIPIQRDFTNFDEALERIRNPEEIQKIADQARKDIVYSGKYSYKAFASELERAIDDHHYSKIKRKYEGSESGSFKMVLNSIDNHLINERNELVVLENHLQEVFRTDQLREGFQADLKQTLKIFVLEVVEKILSTVRKWVFRITWYLALLSLLIILLLILNIF